MLPVVIVKIAQIAVGVAVGNVASDAFDKVLEETKKVIEKKKGA